MSSFIRLAIMCKFTGYNKLPELKTNYRKYELIPVVEDTSTQYLK